MICNCQRRGGPVSASSAHRLRLRQRRLTRRCICQGRAGSVLIFGELSATMVLGRLRAPGPAGWVVAARALQLNARSVRRTRRTVDASRTMSRILLALAVPLASRLLSRRPAPQAPRAQRRRTRQALRVRTTRRALLSRRTIDRLPNRSLLYFGRTCEEHAASITEGRVSSDAGLPSRKDSGPTAGQPKCGAITVRLHSRL